MDCYLVVIHWPSEAFGGNRIWNLAIKTTDGATIFTYLGINDKFKLINKWENSTMKNEVEVRGIDWSSEWNYTIKFWCVMIFFWSKMQNCFEKKGKKKIRPLQIKRWDRAYGLTLSLVTLTGLCCYVHPKNSWINAEVTTDSTLF